MNKQEHDQEEMADILEYCQKNIKEKWASNVVSLLLKVDIKDAEKSVREWLKENRKKVGDA